MDEKEKYREAINNIKVSDEMKNRLNEKIRLENASSNTNNESINSEKINNESINNENPNNAKSNIGRINTEKKKLRTYTFFTSMAAACILLCLVGGYTINRGMLSNKENFAQASREPSIVNHKREFMEEQELEGIKKFKDDEDFREYLEKNLETDVVRNGDIVAKGLSVDSIEDSEMMSPNAGSLKDEMATAETSSASKDSSGTSNGMSSDDYSKTNVQVENVDEADIIKTNGKYIFALVYDEETYANKIVCIDVEKQEKISEVNIESYEENEYYLPSEMFLYEDKLVVIANSRRRLLSGLVDYMETNSVLKVEKPNTTKVFVFKIQDGELEMVRKVELSGYYSSSRMVNGIVYLLTNQNIGSVYDIRNEETDLKNYLPAYGDSIKEDFSNSKDILDYNDLKYKESKDIYYFDDDKVYYDYTNIGAFDLNGDEPMNVKTILGATGQSIYANDSNIYINRVLYPDSKWFNSFFGESPETEIFKIAIFGTELNFVAKGKIKGVLLNQFSMDEYDGYFRVAVTEENYVGNEWEEKNSLYVLDEMMNVVGQIKGFAKDESIYSVRFMGKRGFVVTFRQIDPLIVMDLSDPTNPKITGELKIPGVSKYLQMYDENHIVGVGEDIVVEESIYGETARKNGLKISYFDVSDMENPIEVNNVTFGNSISYSEAENNHKAVLLSNEKGVLAIPVSLNNDYFDDVAMVDLFNEDADTDIVEDEVEENDEQDFDNNNFRGIMVFDIDAQDGVSMKGQIESTNGFGTNRVIYIGNNYYALSDERVNVVNMETLESVNMIDLR